MLKERLFKPRQLESLDTLFETAAALAGTKGPTTHARVYQMAGTNMADLQLGFALRLADRRSWHSLVVYPEVLRASLPPLLPRGRVLDPDYLTGTLQQALAWEPGGEGRPYVTLCTMPQLAEALRPPEAAAADGDATAPAGDRAQPARGARGRMPPPDEFDLLILHDPNEQIRHDYDFALDHFSGARLAVRWMSAKSDSVFPRNSVKSGVITLNVQAALAAAS